MSKRTLDLVTGLFVGLSIAWIIQFIPYRVTIEIPSYPYPLYVYWRILDPQSGDLLMGLILLVNTLILVIANAVLTRFER